MTRKDLANYNMNGFIYSTTMIFETFNKWKNGWKKAYIK